RTPNGRGYCPRYRACRTNGRQGSPAPQRRYAAPSGSQTRNQRSASGSSVPDRSKVGLCGSNTVQAPCAPNPSRAPHRSGGLSDQEALPCRDQTHKRIGSVHHLAVPSSTAPANHRLNPTESRFAHRLNESFATQSPRKRTESRGLVCPLGGPFVAFALYFSL